VFLLLLFVSALSTKIESKIDSHEFQEIIDDFVEVHKAASEDIDLGLILTNVKSGITKAEKTFGDFISGFVKSCNYAKGKVDGFVTKLGKVINSLQKEANDWNDAAKKAAKDSKSNAKNLADTQGRLKTLLEDMANLAITYKQTVGESDAKLYIIKQLWDIIEDELLNPTTKSFIQVKFNKKLTKLQEMVKKSGDILYTPLISALVELAAEGHFSDQTILKKILKTLGELRKNIEKFRADKETELNESMKTYKSQEQNLEDQIFDYTKLGSSYVSVSAEAHQSMQILTKDIQSLGDEVKRKQAEALSVSHLCDLENNLFKGGKKRMDLIIGDLKTALGQAQQLK